MRLLSSLRSQCRFIDFDLGGDDDISATHQGVPGWYWSTMAISLITGGSDDAVQCRRIVVFKKIAGKRVSEARCE